MNDDMRDSGAILATLGVTEGETLARALNLDAYLGHPDGLEFLAAGEALPLGELLRAAQRRSAGTGFTVAKNMAFGG